MLFCLGTVQLGTQYGIQKNNRPSFNETKQILINALNSGISFFDTAALYGEAEQLLGNFATENPLLGKRMKIISKLTPRAFEGIPDKEWPLIALQNAKTSLDKVKQKQFEAYLFHNASYIYNHKAVEALDIVRQKGLSKKIGVSVYTPQEALKALEYPQIEVIQVPYNVFDRRLDQCNFFSLAKQKNVEVFARSSLLQGLATMSLDQLPSHMEFAKSYLAQYLSICNEFNFTPLEAAINYITTHPEIDYLVFGVDNNDQLSEYIAASNKTLPEKMRLTLDDTFRSVDEKLVNPSLW